MCYIDLLFYQKNLRAKLYSFISVLFIRMLFFFTMVSFHLSKTNAAIEHWLKLLKQTFVKASGSGRQTKSVVNWFYTKWGVKLFLSTCDWPVLQWTKLLIFSLIALLGTCWSVIFFFKSLPLYGIPNSLSSFKNLIWPKPSSYVLD